MPNIYTPDFWESEEDALWTDMAEIFIDAYLSGVEGGVETLPPNARVLVDFDYVNTQVLDYARQYRYGLIKDITSTTRGQVQQAISDWIQSGQPLSVLEAQIAPIFGMARATAISVTEVTRVFAEGNAQAWMSTGIVNDVRFNTAEDDLVCKFCSPLDGQTFPVDDYGHKPPIHVRCRCFNTPVVSEEAFERRLEEIFG